MVLKINIITLLASVILLSLLNISYAEHFQPLTLSLKTESNTGSTEDNITNENFPKIVVSGNSYFKTPSCSGECTNLEIVIKNNNIVPPDGDFSTPTFLVDELPMRIIRLVAGDFPVEFLTGNKVNDGTYTIFVREVSLNPTEHTGEVDTGEPAPFTFTIETVPPVVTITETNENTAIFEITATDDGGSGVSEISYLLKDSPADTSADICEGVDTSSGTTPYTEPINLSGFANRSKTLCAYAMDVADNIGFASQDLSSVPFIQTTISNETIYFEENKPFDITGTYDVGFTNVSASYTAMSTEIETSIPAENFIINDTNETFTVSFPVGLPEDRYTVTVNVDDGETPSVVSSHATLDIAVSGPPPAPSSDVVGYVERGEPTITFNISWLAPTVIVPIERYSVKVFETANNSVVPFENNNVVGTHINTGDVLLPNTNYTVSISVFNVLGLKSDTPLQTTFDSGNINHNGSVAFNFEDQQANNVSVPVVSVIAGVILSDEDNLVPLSQVYVWKRDGVVVDGETGNMYIITDIDLGTTISVEVTYEDSFGPGQTAENSFNVSSSAGAPPSVAPTLSPLTYDANITILDIKDDDITINWGWDENGNTGSGITGFEICLENDIVVTSADPCNGMINGIPDVSAREHTEKVGDAAKYIFRIRAVNSYGNSQWSEPQSVISDRPAEYTITKTGVEGIYSVRDEVTLSFTDLDATSEIIYQWKADDIDIQGATSETYSIGGSDFGKILTVEVSYSQPHFAGTPILLPDQISDIKRVEPTTPIQTLTAINGGFNVEWLAVSAGGDVITEYVIGYSEGGGEEVQVKVIANSEDVPGVTQYDKKITGLDLNSVYSVTLSATNNIGTSISAAKEVTISSIDTPGTLSFTSGSTDLVDGDELTKTFAVGDEITLTLEDTDGILIEGDNTTFTWKRITSSGEVKIIDDKKTVEGISNTLVSTYTPVIDDLHSALKVEVSYTDANTELPKILTFSPGIWNDDSMIQVEGHTDSDTDINFSDYIVRLQGETDITNFVVTPGINSLDLTWDQYSTGIQTINELADIKNNFIYKVSYVSSRSGGLENIELTENVEVGDGNVISHTISNLLSVTGYSIQVFFGSKSDQYTKYGAFVNAGDKQSEPVNVVTLLDNKPGFIVINGAPLVGQVLSVFFNDENNPINIQYQWKEVGEGGGLTDIVGETGNMYTLTNDDVGKTLAVTATYEDDFTVGSSISVTSNSFYEILSNLPHNNIGLNFFRWVSNTPFSDLSSFPFAGDVSISGNYAVSSVSASLNEEGESDVNVWKRSEDGESWILDGGNLISARQDILHPEYLGEGDERYIGYEKNSIDIKENSDGTVYLAVGMPESIYHINNIPYEGTILIFERNLSGVWSLKARILGNHVEGEDISYDGLGSSVKIVGDKIFTGDRNISFGVINRQTNGEWGVDNVNFTESIIRGVNYYDQLQSISDVTFSNIAFSNIEFLDNQLYISTYNLASTTIIPLGQEQRVFRFSFDDASNSWVNEPNPITAPVDLQDLNKFGTGFAARGNTLLISDTNENVLGTNNNGAVYVYTREGSGFPWIYHSKLIPSYTDTDLAFGANVKISDDENTIVVASEKQTPYNIFLYRKNVSEEGTISWGREQEGVSGRIEDYVIQRDDIEFLGGDFKGGYIDISGNDLVISDIIPRGSGNSRAHGTYFYKIDFSAPPAPTVILENNNNTGSKDDKVTSTPIFSVSGIEAGNKLEYKSLLNDWVQVIDSEVVDGNTTITIHTGDGTLNQGDQTYHFRQRNNVGIVSDEVEFTIFVDTIAPTEMPILSLTNDAGDINDNITNDPRISVAFPEGETTYTFEYSSDNINWIKVQGSSMFLDADIGVDGSKTYYVRFLDAAENEGPSNSITFTLDTAQLTTDTTIDISQELSDGYINSLERQSGVSIEGSVDRNATSIRVQWGKVVKTSTLSNQETYSVNFLSSEISTGDIQSIAFSVSGVKSVSNPVSVVLDTVFPNIVSNTLVENESGLTITGEISQLKLLNRIVDQGDTGGAVLHNASDIDIQGDYAYVVTYGDDLQGTTRTKFQNESFEILNISDPNNLSKVSGLVHNKDASGNVINEFLNSPRSVAVLDNYAIIGTKGGIEVIDTLDKQNPVHVPALSIDLRKYVQDNEILYSDGTRVVADENDVVKNLQIKRVSHFVLVFGSYGDSNAFFVIINYDNDNISLQTSDDIQISDFLANFSIDKNSTGDLYTAKDLLLKTNNEGLVQFDILLFNSESSNSKILIDAFDFSSFDTIHFSQDIENVELSEIVNSDNFSYLFNEDDNVVGNSNAKSIKIKILEKTFDVNSVFDGFADRGDVSLPIITRTDIDDGFGFVDSIVTNNYIYAISKNYDAVFVIDISNPTNPTLISEIKTNNNNDISIHDLPTAAAFENGYLFITLAGDGGNGVQAVSNNDVDVSVKTNWGGVQKTSSVNDSGEYTILYSDEEIPSGNREIILMASDAAGNEKTETIIVPSIDSVIESTGGDYIGDGVINIEESEGNITISGVSAPDVNLILNWEGHTQNTTADGSGAYSFIVSTENIPKVYDEVVENADGSRSITVTADRENAGLRATLEWEGYTAYSHYFSDNEMFLYTFEVPSKNVPVSNDVNTIVIDGIKKDTNFSVSSVIGDTSIEVNKAVVIDRNNKFTENELECSCESSLHSIAESNSDLRFKVASLPNFEGVAIITDENGETEILAKNLAKTEVVWAESSEYYIFETVFTTSELQENLTEVIDGFRYLYINTIFTSDTGNKVETFFALKFDFVLPTIESGPYILVGEDSDLGGLVNFSRDISNPAHIKVGDSIVIYYATNERTIVDDVNLLINSHIVENTPNDLVYDSDEAISVFGTNVDSSLRYKRSIFHFEEDVVGEDAEGLIQYSISNITDSAGNINNTPYAGNIQYYDIENDEVINIVLDKTVPVINSVIIEKQVPGINTEYAKENDIITISANISDDTFILSDPVIKIDGVSISPEITRTDEDFSDGVAAFTFLVPAGINGVITAELSHIVDKAGLESNITVTSAENITADTSAPVLTIISQDPLGNNQINPSTRTLEEAVLKVVVQSNESVNITYGGSCSEGPIIHPDITELDDTGIQTTLIFEGFPQTEEVEYTDCTITSRDVVGNETTITIPSFTMPILGPTKSFLNLSGNLVDNEPDIDINDGLIFILSAGESPISPSILSSLVVTPSSGTKEEHITRIQTEIANGDSKYDITGNGEITLNDGLIFILSAGESPISPSILSPLVEDADDKEQVITDFQAILE